MPIYKLNGKTYNIPDDVVANFEKDNPDATIGYSVGDKKYEIPVSKREGFLQAYPKAVLTGTEQPSMVEQTKETNEQATNPNMTFTQEQLDSMERNVPQSDTVSQQVQQHNMNTYALTNPTDEEKGVVIDEQQRKRQLDEQISAAEKELEQVKKELEPLDRQFIGRLASNAVNGHGGGGANHSEPVGTSKRDKLLMRQRQIEDRIDTLEESRDRDTSGFWRNLWKTVTNPSNWSFGLIPIQDAFTASRVADKLEDGTELTEDDEQLLQSMVLNQEAQEKYGDDKGFMARAGSLTGEALPFVAEFILTGGYGGVAEGVGGAVTRGIAKATATDLTKKGLRSWLVKATGTVAGDVTSAALMANSTGAAKTAADAMERHRGSTVIQDENGDYHIGHYEQNEDGMPVWVDGGKTLAHSIYEAEAANTLEYYTELLGKHVEKPLGAIGSWIAEKTGMKKAGAYMVGKLGLAEVSKDLSQVTANGYGRAFKHVLERGGIQDYPSEVLEEEANIVLNSMFVGDNSLSDLVDGRTQADIWGGMFFSVGFMQSPAVVGGGITAAGYLRTKHQLDKADKVAGFRMTDERWQPLRERIDGTDNEHFKDLAAEILSDESMASQEKMAALRYMAQLAKFRGYNVGTAAKAKDEVENPSGEQQGTVRRDLNTSYIGGYEANDEQLNDIKNGYEFQRQKAIDTFGEIKGFDEDPITTLQTMREGGFTPEQIQIAIDYVNAKAAYDGMIARVGDDIDSRINASNSLVDSHTNKEDGMVHPVTSKTDQKMYIVGGQVVMNAEGTGVDTEKSLEANADGMLLAVDAETGKIVTLSVDDIVSADAPIDAAEQKQLAQEQIRQQYAQQEADKIDGVLSFNQGDVYNVIADDGQQHTVQVLQDQGDGTVSVLLDGAQEPTVAAKDTIQSWADAANLARLQQYEQEKEQQRAQQAAAEAEAARPQYNLNDVLTLRVGDGSVLGSITAEPNADGQYEVYTEEPINGKKVNLFTRDELDSMLMEHNGNVAQQSQPTENNKAEQQEQQVEEKKEEEQRPAIERIPILRDENGKPVLNRKGKPTYQWHEAAVEDTADALTEQAGGSMLTARDVATDMVGKAKEQLEKVRKQKPKGDDPIELIESRNAIQQAEQQAQDIVKYWQDVNQEIQKRMREESARKVAEAEAAKSEQQRQKEAEEKRQQEERQNEIERQRLREAIEKDHERRNREYEPMTKARKEMASDPDALGILDDTEPRDLEEWVSSLLIPHSILWQDASESEAGLRSELGLKRGDMQRFMNLLGTKENGAKPFGKVVLDIYEGLPESMKEQYTDQDVRNTLLELFNEGSSGRMMNLTKEHRIEEARAQYQENMRRDAEAEMEAWAEAYHLTPEERETFEDFMQQPPTAVDEEIINQIIADNEQNRRSEEVDREPVGQGEESEVRGSTGEVSGQGATEETGGNNEPAEQQHGQIQSDHAFVSGDDVAGREQALAERVVVNDDDWTEDSDDGTVYKRTITIDDAHSVTQVDEPNDKGDYTGSYFLYEGKRFGGLPEVIAYIDESAQLGDTSSADEIAAEEAKVDTNPSEAQKEAGNYKKGHIQVDGYEITIENPKGSVRSGVDSKGNRWETTMRNTYGYIRRTEGVDGDHIDVFLSDNPTSGNVFVIDQVNPETGEFDEHKVMYGFASEEEARKAYLSNYSKGWKGLGTITEVSREEFKKWVESSHRKTKPFAEYKSVKRTEGQNEQRDPRYNEGWDGDYSKWKARRDYLDEKDVRKYESKKKQYEADQAYCHNEIPRLEGQIKEIKRRIEDNKKNLVTVEALPKEKVITVGKQTFKSVDEMEDFIKEHNKKIKEVENDLRDNPSTQSSFRELTVNVGGLDFKIKTEQFVETKEGNGTLFTAVHRRMTYDCDALGLKDVPVNRSMLVEALNDIMNNVVTGKDFKERVEYGERSLSNLEKQLSQVKERYGKPFEYNEELKKAHERYDEYADLMKKELEEKEKKYAEMDAEVEDIDDVTEAEEAEEEEEDTDDSRFRDDEEDIEDINNQFNKELQMQIDGTLPQGHVYDIGMPSEILLSTGFPNVPIELSASHLAAKAAAAHHSFDIGDVKDLVKALQHPMAVFVYGDKGKAQNVIVEIQHEGKNFVVGIHFNQERRGAVVSDIRGLYPKDNAEWLNWISQGKLLYADKEKIQNLIAQQRRTLAEVSYLDLNSVAKIVKDFENPKLSEENLSEGNEYFREVDDEETIKRLESEPTIKVYRSMQLIDGKLYPPMSAKVDGKLRQPTELGKWEEAEERPEMADENGYFTLNKGNGKSLKARYNPYIHTSRTMLNDQFSEAQDRDNLVVVEMEVPVSELTSGYKAEKAKDSVGAKQWKAGVIQGQLTGTREVILSRWAKPVRIVPVEEVADNIADQIAGQVSVMPTNVVTPQQREALEERGIKFVETDNKGKIKEGVNVGKSWKSVYGKKRSKRTMKREGVERPEENTSGTVTGRTAAQQRKAVEYAQRQWRRAHEVADEWVQKLGLADVIQVVDSIEEVEGNESFSKRKRRAKGWYDPKTGKIYIVLGNHRSPSDVLQTILHEAVGHYGLRKLFGQNFDTFLDNVYQAASLDVKERIAALAAKLRAKDSAANRARRTNQDYMRIATEEYLASLAEDTDFERATDSGWFEKIKELFMQMLRKIGLRGFADRGVELTDNELRYILWRSYKNMAEPGRYRNVFDVAENIAMEVKLGVGNNVKERARIQRTGKTDTGKFAADGATIIRMGHIEDELPLQVMNRQDEEKIRQRVAHLTAAEALEAYKRINSQMLDEEGLDIDEHNEKIKHDWIAEHGLSGIGKAMADDLTALMDKYGSGMVELRWELKDRLEELGVDVAEEGESDLFRDDDFTERDRVTARREYEKMVSSGLYQFREAVQDSMLGLRKLYEAILGKGTNIEDVDGFENAYLAENRMSSVNSAEQHDYYIRFMTPLLKAIGKIAGDSKEARQKLTDYMMAKHGLERNEVMAQRDYDAYRQEHPYGQKTLSNFRDRDYSGLTALTGETDVADAEAAARKIVDDYEREHDVSELWNATKMATQATLEKIYNSGLLSKERYEKIRDMFDYYIPLQGWDETTSDEVYGYLTSKNGPLGGSPIKRAEGRSSKADDPIATIAMMADTAIRQGNRNLMKQRFLNFALNHPSDLVSVHDLWLQYDAASDEWIPVFADIESSDTAADVERKVEAFEQRMEQLAQAEPDHYKRGSDAKNIPYKVVKGNLKEHQILVRRGGRTYVLTINGNPRAAQALNGLTNPDVNIEGIVGNILKAGEWANRNISSLYTTRNPDFVVSNFFRDMLYSNCMTWVKENPRYALRFHKNFGMLNPATMRKLFVKWEKGTLDMNNYTEHMFYLFMMNGGETGYTNVRDIEAHKKEIAKELKKQDSTSRKAFAVLGMQLDLLNRSVENCARFAAFVTSREMGRSIDRSIYDAKEVSVNFNKKGSGGKMVNATGQTMLGKIGSYLGGAGRLLYVFWNAGVQGLTNFGRAGKRNPGKALSGAAAMFVLGYVIPQLAAAMGGGDGDDDDKNAYYNLPEYIRRTNICLRVGDQWIVWPLPIEFRAIYGLGELSSGAISGNEHYSDNELAYQIASQVSQVLPLDMLEGGGGINAFIPSIPKPFVEAYIRNKSWTGLPIYKDTPWNKKDPEWTKAYKNADQTLVDISKWLNEHTGGDDFKKGYIDINPAKLEYLLNGVFGGYANTANKLKKMGETAFGDRDFDWRNMLIANRVVKTGDERTANRKLQNEYFKYKDEYEETKRLEKKYEDAADNGVMGMAEKVNFLYNSKEYLRYQIFDEYKSDIDDMREELAETTDPEERKSIEAEMYGLMRELINELHETDK